MAFDFPAAPAVDQIYTDATSGLSYVFDGSLWLQGTTTSGPVGDAWVLKVGDTMTGALVLPDPDPISPLHSTHKRYVDTTVATNALYQGTWQVAANVPDLNVPPNAPLNGYSYLAQTVDPAVPETAAASIPGIGGTAIAALDTVKWNATLLEWDHIRGATGISQMTIADAAPATAFHGQCWWDFDSGKQYVYYDDGTSQAWVQMSGGGGGQAAVTVAATAPTAPTKGMLWWDTTTGVLYVWYDDGTTTQWVQTNVEEAPIDGQSYARNNAGWVIGGGGTGTPYAVPVGDVMPATALQGELFFNSADASLYIWFDDGTSAQWVEVSASSGGGGGLTQADADLRYLQLTGPVASPMTGPLTISVEHPSIQLRSTSTNGFPNFGVYLNNIQPNWNFDFNDTSYSGDLKLGHSPGSPAAPGSMLYCLNVSRATGVFDFASTPTRSGTPLVLKTEHDALITRIAALEARLAKAKL